MDLRHPEGTSAQPVVLLLEPKEEARALYSIALSASGFNVVAAEDEAEAYRRACDTHPDVIVTDSPDSDALDWAFLRKLHQNARTRGIPVVALKPCLPEDLAGGLHQFLNAYSRAV